ncbi:MAG: hypothetical protein ACRCX2_36430 [Paraclostridium sp.]
MSFVDLNQKTDRLIKNTTDGEVDNEHKENVGLESFNYQQRKDLKAAVDSTLSIFKMLEESEYLRIKDLINSFTKEEELIEFLINPINIYFEPTKEPSGLTLNKIIDKERIIISEPVYLPYKAKVEVDGELYPVRTNKRVTILHTYVRKNQQIANKEARSANTGSVSDILGMAAGGDRVGTFSDSEWAVMLQQNNFNVLKELCGPASADIGQKKEFRSKLVTMGEVSLADLPEDVNNKRALLYLDHKLKEMGIDSSLIKYPE